MDGWVGGWWMDGWMDDLMIGFFYYEF
jgi:hypothetical protein